MSGPSAAIGTERAPGGDCAGEEDDRMRAVEGVEDLAGLHDGAHLGDHRDHPAGQAQALPRVVELRPGRRHGVVGEAELGGGRVEQRVEGGIGGRDGRPRG